LKINYTNNNFNLLIDFFKIIEKYLIKYFKYSKSIRGISLVYRFQLTFKLIQIERYFYHLDFFILYYNPKNSEFRSFSRCFISLDFLQCVLIMGMTRIFPSTQFKWNQWFCIRGRLKKYSHNCHRIVLVSMSRRLLIRRTAHKYP